MAEISTGAHLRLWRLPLSACAIVGNTLSANPVTVAVNGATSPRGATAAMKNAGESARGVSTVQAVVLTQEENGTTAMGHLIGSKHHGESGEEEESG
ncbi:MAG: hypothetical protein NTX75_12490 [Proteobacteria bacterium]|nr:hypothetical protein [Pseudomonadota bacterium]